MREFGSAEAMTLHIVARFHAHSGLEETLVHTMAVLERAPALIDHEFEAVRCERML